MALWSYCQSLSIRPRKVLIQAILQSLPVEDLFRKAVNSHFALITKYSYHVNAIPVISINNKYTVSPQEIATQWHLTNTKKIRKKQTVSLFHSSFPYVIIPSEEISYH